MDTLSYKTVSANKENAQKEWLVVDAENQVLGRFSSKVANLLRGKHKTNFTPNADCGDYVIVINADKIRLTGKKMQTKEYQSYSGYPGGQKTIVAKDMMAKFPTRMVEKAVKGMLAKTKLGNAVYGNLHVYAGSAHPHEAQKPKNVTL